MKAPTQATVVRLAHRFIALGDCYVNRRARVPNLLSAIEEISHRVAPMPVYRVTPALVEPAPYIVQYKLFDHGRLNKILKERMDKTTQRLIESRAKSVRQDADKNEQRLNFLKRQVEELRRSRGRVPWVLAKLVEGAETIIGWQKSDAQVLEDKEENMRKKRLGAAIQKMRERREKLEQEFRGKK